MRFYVGEILDAASEVEIRAALCNLADELNSDLDGYTVSMEHLDSYDYLTFTPGERGESDAGNDDRQNG